MEIFQPTQIYKVECLNGNTVYIKRDDLLPYSFGGNKARKASLFFKEIEVGGYNAVVTYGSGGSNHCRIVANMAAERKLICHIISPDTESNSLNRRMVEMFGAKITSCAVDKVADTIDTVINSLKKCGLKPYFIPGGGHGNIGTHAYDLAYDEIKQYEFENKLTFDFIFLLPEPEQLTQVLSVDWNATMIKSKLSALALQEKILVESKLYLIALQITLAIAMRTM
ncbi:MAG: pyridoxal-phosphate dependent enzyme [Lachnospiraceae bacterium]|nr:pyridoxal-phosphate dependent enzyme [Lachnospiraceae bacterium]